MTTYTVVGKPVGRVEGPDKVTGRAVYPADVTLPGMLWAKVLRSPLPHARILKIDASRARRLRGVHAVLTGADIPDVRTGRMLKDIPLLARDRVRFIGEKVAAVAAADPDIAEEALLLIDVEYAELPAVFDPLEALAPGAPVLHENVDAYERGQVPLWTPGFPKPEGLPNLFSRWTWGQGNVEEGFAQADHVFEHRFTLPVVHHAYMEPHACVIHIDDTGRVQVWANNKTPIILRRQLASAANIPVERINVNVTHIGGDFGGKGAPMDAPLLYYVAQAAGHPVKMVMTYMEEFLAGNPRHPGYIIIKSGVKRDGTLVARQGRGVLNSGAYGAFKPAGNIFGINHLGGCYRIPHVVIQADCVYTNTVPHGHMRAPGSPQAVFAAESHMDMIAKELGMDPLELRLKNVLHEGDASPTGHRWHEVRAEETLRTAVKVAGWGTPKGRNIGRGIALFDHPIGVGEASATVTVDADGVATLYSPTADTGTGIHTVQRQIVAEELTVPLERVSIMRVDTDATPSATDSGVGASRTTYVAGQAALQAVRQVKERLTQVAAELLESPPERLQLRNGRFTVGPGGGRSVTLAEVAARAAATGGPVSALVTYKSETPEVTSFCAQVAEVEVDPETGQVRVRKFVNVVDSGTVLNPISYHGQLNGGIAMGLGYALMEEMPVEEGRVTTVHFGDYKIPTIADIPPLQTVLLESPSGPTPYQGKAVGETSNCPVTGAVANAVADAVGVRITGLPITAEKVLAALRQAQGRR